MKRFLRLLEKIRLRRKLSTASYEQSEMSPQLSAVSYQSSALNGWQLVKYCALDRARSLRIFLQSILVFVSCSAALAQDVDVHSTPAAQAETEITPLKIGDKIPDELWEMYFPVVSANSDQVQYLSLGDFKDKLIILDFWATWCAPCITSLHKLDTLQVQFKDDLMVIPTSYEPESKVKPFLISKTINLSSLIEETELKKYFPHRSIPHQVWIKNGEVLAIVGPEYANKAIINNVINGKDVAFDNKMMDINFDQSKPLFYQENGGDGSDMLYQSIITRRLNARIGGMLRPKPSSIMVYNRSISQMFRYAFEYQFPFLFSNKFIRYELKEEDINKVDFEKVINADFDIKMEWAKNNLYCYNLVLSPNYDSEAVNDKMLKDLNHFFGSEYGFHVKIKERTIKAWTLVKLPRFSGLASKGGETMKKWDSVNNQLIIENDNLSYLTYCLNVSYKSSPFLFVDKTEIDYNIDLVINASLRDLEKLKTELNKHGLDLIEKPTNVQMIVFSYTNESV